MGKSQRRNVAREEVRRRVCKYLGTNALPTDPILKIEESKDPEKISFENTHLKMQLLDKNRSKIFQNNFGRRRKLPAMQKGIDCLQAIKDRQVLLVVGSKGSGKSTQIPQMLLDEYIYNNRASECRIICLQSKGYKAIALAERVAYERDEKLGNCAIGIHTKKQNIAPRENGSILFCTAGILMKKIQNDPFLEHFSAVILDDVNENPYEYKHIMELLAIMLPFRPDMKLILLSTCVYIYKIKIKEFFKHFHTFYIDEAEETKPSNGQTLKKTNIQDIKKVLDSKSIRDDASRNNTEVKTFQITHSGDQGYGSTIKPITGSGRLRPQHYEQFTQPDNFFTTTATTATIGNTIYNKSGDLDKEAIKAETEYRCSIAFLWMYADSDLSSCSDWDRALINSNREQITSFERTYPQLADKETAILLEKTNINCCEEKTYKRKENTNVRGRVTEITVKRSHEPVDDAPTSSKKQKTLSCTTTTTNGGLQVAIVDWSDLDGNIRPANWLLLEELLLNEMISDKWSDETISFDGAEWSGGVKVVKCGNERSLEFLKVTIAGIGELWPRAQLDVIPQSRLPLRIFINMWIPPPVPSVRDVFELLGKQNEGLVTDDWQIISAIPCKIDYGTTFRLAIDANSLKRLNERQGRARFGFGFINIRAE